VPTPPCQLAALKRKNPRYGFSQALGRDRLRYHWCSWYLLLDAIERPLLNRRGDEDYRRTADLPEPTGNFYPLFGAFEPDIYLPTQAQAGG
jgi:hypothetical protein